MLVFSLVSVMSIEGGEVWLAGGVCGLVVLTRVCRWTDWCVMDIN